MERNSEILRRDAKAPLCLEPLPIWRYEHFFRATLREFLPSDSSLLASGVDFLAEHHAHSQNFVKWVDDIIVSKPLSQPRIRRSLMGLLDTCRGLEELEESEQVVERMREVLAEKCPAEQGSLPEFAWEKGAAALFFERIREAGVETNWSEEELFVHIDDVYDDCARTVQLGLWIMATSWRADVVDAWLFESAYAFFHHTLPGHIKGKQGLMARLSACLTELKA